VFHITFVCASWFFLVLFAIRFVTVCVFVYSDFSWISISSIDNHFYKQSAIFHKSLAGIELATTIRCALFLFFHGIVFLFEIRFSFVLRIFGIPSDAFCNFSWLTLLATSRRVSAKVRGVVKGAIFYVYQLKIITYGFAYSDLFYL